MNIKTLFKYLCDSTNRNTIAANKNSNIVAVIQNKSQIELLDDASNHIPIQTDANFDQEFLRIEKILKSSVEADKLVQHLQNLYLRDNNLNNLSTGISKTIDSPFSVLSTQGEVLMSTKNFIDWDYTNITQVRDCLAENKSQTNLDKCEVFIRPIAYQNCQLGALICPSEHNDKDLLKNLLLDKIVDFLALIFQSRSAVNTNNSKLQPASLLSNLIHSDQLNQFNSANEFVRLKQVRYLMILKMPVAVSQPYFENLINQLSGYLSDSYYCLENGNLVILTSYKQLLIRTDKRFLKFSRYLSQNNIKFSLSMPFENNKNIRLSYHQAVVALSYQSSSEITDNPIMYQDISTLEIFSLLKEQSNIIEYIHPDISFLEDYDKRHKTEYLNTLHIYLYNDLNSSKSAKMLNIHPNTLLYRIAKIKELLSYDLDFGKQNLDYRISYLILYSLNRIKLPLLRDDRYEE